MKKARRTQDRGGHLIIRHRLSPSAKDGDPTEPVGDKVDDTADLGGGLPHFGMNQMNGKRLGLFRLEDCFKRPGLQIRADLMGQDLTERSFLPGHVDRGGDTAVLTR